MPDCNDQNRREWMLRLLSTTAGAALVSPAFARAHEHASASAATENAAAWHPAFLSASQNEELTSLGERIIPGSTAAACNRVIDLVLSLEPDGTKRQFVAALTLFDEHAQKVGRKRFHDLAPAQQDQVLASVADDKGAAGEAFRFIKEWMADAYWSSREGMRELGWTGRMAWEKFDGCAHAGAHS